MTSETAKAILSLGRPELVNMSPPPGKGDLVCFPLDERNPGGRKLIEISHSNHRRALSRIVSEIGKVMKAPHAHINNVKGMRN